MSDLCYPMAKTAVILVDPFNDFISLRGKLSLLLRKVARQAGTVNHLKQVIACARENKLQIIYAPHERYRDGLYSERDYLHPSQVGQLSARIFADNKFGGQFHKSFTPQTGDLIASPHSCSSGFADTDLHEILSNHGITHLIIIGYLSNTCIEATARSAVDLDYHVTLVTDAVASWSPQDHAAAVEVNYPQLAQQVLTTNSLIAALDNEGGTHA